MTDLVLPPVLVVCRNVGGFLMLAPSPDMAPVEMCLVSAPGKVILHGEHAVVHGKVKGPIKHTSLTGADRTSIMLQV